MPDKMQVTAQVPGKGDKPGLGPCTVTVTTGKDATEMIKLFGAEAVKTNAEANWKVTLQANIRAGLKRGETPEQIQARLGSSKMGVAAQGAKVDPVQAYYATFQSATPEEQAKMLAELQKRAAAK